MTPHQQELIRSTWSQVAPISDSAARIFYDRLFALDPGIAPMFAFTDMEAQRKNLMQTLAVVVKSIDDLATIVPAVEAMGRRHAAYGVHPSQYATVGTALLDTLAVGLGDAFTPDARAAWCEAFETLASVMLAAAASESRTTASAA
jgi:hemoglobin-like flavoprotein